MNGNLPIAFYEFWADQNFHNNHPLENIAYRDLDISKIPMLQRRRLSMLDKIFMHLIQQIPTNYSQNAPIIAGSRYGEMQRTVNLFSQIQKNEPLSPTDFSHSVLNTPIALHSILNKNTQNHLAISGGRYTLMSTLIEANSYFKANPSHDLIVIIADETLPAPFIRDKSEGSPYSYGLLLYLSNNNPTIDLSWSANKQTNININFMFFDFIKGLLSTSNSFAISSYQQNISFQKTQLC